MSFDLQKRDVAAQSPRLAPEFKKTSYLELGVTRLKHVKSTRQLEEEAHYPKVLATASKQHISLISDSRIYALKRRLLAPTWWVEGILLSLGAKEVWFDSLITSKAGKFIISPPQVTGKNISLMFAVWHEILSQMFSATGENLSFRFQINKYLSGTQKDILNECKQLEEIWASPMGLFEVKSSKKTKSLSLAKAGSLGLIHHAHIEQEVDGIWLSLSLSQSLHNFYSSQNQVFHNHSPRPSYVSINPVVIQSMGRRASIKKVINYLYLEYSKQESNDAVINNWHSVPIECKNINSFHKEMLVNVPSLYDHGVLGWNISAPNIKLSELKNKISENKQLQCQNVGTVVYCWQLSHQAKEAIELEQAISDKLTALSHNFAMESQQQATDSHPFSKYIAASQPDETLFPEPPADELKKARKEKALKIEKFEKKAEKKVVVPKSEPLTKKIIKKIPPCTLFDSSESSALNVSSKVVQDAASPKKNLVKKKIISVKDTLSDNEFLVLVSEFYEALKPLQKKAFERERAGMTPEQFRVYMTPILKRKISKKTI